MRSMLGKLLVSRVNMGRKKNSFKLKHLAYVKTDELFYDLKQK